MAKRRRFLEDTPNLSRLSGGIIPSTYQDVRWRKATNKKFIKNIQASPPVAKAPNTINKH